MSAQRQGVDIGDKHAPPCKIDLTFTPELIQKGSNCLPRGPDQICHVLMCEIMANPVSLTILLSLIFGKFSDKFNHASTYILEYKSLNPAF